MEKETVNNQVRAKEQREKSGSNLPTSTSFGENSVVKDDHQSSNRPKRARIRAYRRIDYWE